MLLLTYDPKEKQTPDYSVSLTSPYGSGARMKALRDHLGTMLYFSIASTLPMSKEERAKLNIDIADFGLRPIPPIWNDVK